MREHTREKRGSLSEKSFFFDIENYPVYRLPINSIYTSALMVSAQQEEVLWIFDFVREQETDGLQRLLSTIDIVAQEQVV